jgi:Na+/melibiose symporter-like transporter
MTQLTSMTRPIKIGISLLTVVAGWLLTGVGFTTTAGHPTSTILFLLGIGLFIGGIIAAINWVRKR